jgi:hypothetical protein
MCVFGAESFYRTAAFLLRDSSTHFNPLPLCADAYNLHSNLKRADINIHHFHYVSNTTLKISWKRLQRF